MIGFIIGLAIGALLGIANALVLMRYANKKLKFLMEEGVDLLHGQLEAHRSTLTAIDEGRSVKEIRTATVTSIQRVRKALDYKYERAKSLAQEDTVRNIRGEP